MTPLPPIIRYYHNIIIANPAKTITVKQQEQNKNNSSKNNIHVIMVAAS